MTTSRSVLLISAIALILLALVPAVSAFEVIYDRDLHEYIDTSKSGVQTPKNPNAGSVRVSTQFIGFKDITQAQTLNYLIFEIPHDCGYWDVYDNVKIEEGRYDFTYNFNGKDRPGVLYLNRKTNWLGQVTATQFTIFLNDWDIGDLIGTQYVKMPFYFTTNVNKDGRFTSETNTFLCGGGTYYTLDTSEIKITESTGIMWKHHIKVEEGLRSYYIYIDGLIDGYRYTSQVKFSKDGEVFFNITNPGNNLFRAYLKSEINLVEIISPAGTEYAYPLFESGTPLRTGSVTMTHVDGTPLTGFTVKAVNVITGESYTVSTETDTAVITLPMEQTMTIRDPQTGEYEEAPVGHYYFFGYKSGYNMVFEDGVRVSVLPEKYRPYQFCNILVTTGSPESEKLRTGTVTMTDHNGTRISGFEVKAVNYYTGEEYTVSTDTDVATITLPMDRTVSWRNPQTGQYEDVPVGYYIFFVYKPGYKMISEDGVRISVLPLEYSPYHLGDIIVTSEDGYLTGKHQFQIRSRADLSILQTGTISAQSATTGEWYNATVVNGIATLILPYDTSSAIFPYVGNYYVYATSPGYIPSEYATQISVRPDTQSEIRYILLTPIGGIPEPGNVTLRIQVYSDSWQDIPNPEIHIDGVGGAGWEIWETYTASSAGYAEISVPGNSTYDITVYGQGYYSSSQRVEVGDTDPPLTVFILYPTGAPTLTPPTTQPTGWVTPPPTTQPPPGIPDEDDKSEGFLSEAIRGISKIFGVGFATGKTIFGMLLALAIGFTTAKKLRGGAAEFGLGLLGGTMLGVLIGLLPVWTVVVLLLIVGMYIGYRYVGGGNNG